jgi:hypothetical protein
MKSSSATALRFSNGSPNAAFADGKKREAQRIRILAISDYEGLRASREQVLRIKGFQVESVPSSAVFEDNWVRSFDIAILCQSVDSGRAARIAEILHRLNPGLALLHIGPPLPSMNSPSLFDFEMEGLAGPQGLLNAVELIGRRIQNG